MCLYESGWRMAGFRWPRVEDGVIRLTAAQLSALLEGLDWRRVHGFRRPRRCITIWKAVENPRLAFSTTFRSQRFRMNFACSGHGRNRTRC